MGCLFVYGCLSYHLVRTLLSTLPDVALSCYGLSICLWVFVIPLGQNSSIYSSWCCFVLLWIVYLFMGVCHTTWSELFYLLFLMLLCPVMDCLFVYGCLSYHLVRTLLSTLPDVALSWYGLSIGYGCLSFDLVKPRPLISIICFVWKRSLMRVKYSKRPYDRSCRLNPIHEWNDCPKRLSCNISLPPYDFGAFFGVFMIIVSLLSSLHYNILHKK